MPLQRCSVNNKSGWRWGNSGKCYTGEDAKRRAILQGVAIGKGNLLMTKEEVSLDATKHEVAVVKSMHAIERGIIYGVVYAPDEIDTQGDWTDPDTIEKAAHAFLPSAMLNIEHSKDVEYGWDAAIVESYIAPQDITLGESPVKKGTWVIAVKINNEELLQQVKDGLLDGFSLEGYAYRENVELTAGDVTV